MRLITYMLLLVYALPIFLISYAAYSTEWFSSREGTVYVAHAISGPFFSLFRDTFGSIIVPLITAYSITKRENEMEIPKATIWFLMALIIFFVIVTGLYGIVKYNEEGLANFNVGTSDIPKLFQDVILMYAKETLAYIALVLGISLKK
ncbi:hypothetical protein Undi14_01410 [Undibacterium sp. 14-3-2]|uniref:hypothetical protein n=1 Tax=Undibacterium sp. 14-3-2 TaxID=2800129 RepID=UPI0019074113|nr:hypothetical protein [Undibacterium sp. 14-3-2]MBK1888674.1 hypothetical protein [Undibacterium sp. 14-3-2]